MRRLTHVLLQTPVDGESPELALPDAAVEVDVEQVLA